jgi:hypothetical protein
MTGKPLVLVDVDGVVNPTYKRVPPGGKTCHPPYCACHRHVIRHRAYPDGMKYTLLLNPAHGRQLQALAREYDAELVWATYWGDHANHWVAPKLGLPRLPFVPIPRCQEGTLGDWKARHVARWAAGRPFVWFDDEPDIPAALAGLDGVGPHLVVTVDDRAGLTDDHFRRAREWLMSAGRE